MRIAQGGGHSNTHTVAASSLNPNRFTHPLLIFGAGWGCVRWRISLSFGRLSEFDGRSDYGPFIEAGVPAGGLFAGADGIKTPEERATLGGLANAQYDPCYHRGCDTLANVDTGVLGDMAAVAGTCSKASR